MKTKTRKNKLISFFLTLAVMFGLFAALPLTVSADDAGTLATIINGFDPGNGGAITGQLRPSITGNTVTVTGTVTGATKELKLNINSGVTVKWAADYSGSVPGRLIYLSGNGKFEIAAGGSLKQSYDSSGALYIDGPNTINVSGGTVSSTGGYATITSATGQNSVINVNSGTVSSTRSNGTIASRGGSVNISGGTVSALNSSAIYASDGSVVKITGGIVSNTSSLNAGAVTARGSTTTVNVSGGFVFAYGTAIQGIDKCVLIFESGAPAPTISGNAVVCAWNRSASGITAYIEDTATDLIVNSGSTVKWGKNSGQNGISYAKNTNSGFFPVSGVTVNPVPIYAVKVIGGMGDGNYAAGTTVNIEANFIAGKVFDKWTAEGVTLSDPNNAKTSFVMPAKAVTVTASFKAAPPAIYTVTVNNGTGGGSYTAGATVNITANAAPAGKAFDKWTTSDGVSFANAANASTSFTMPSKAVAVTAVYKDLPAETYAVNITAGIGGTANANVAYAKKGDTVILTVSEGEGYIFKKWDVINGPVIIMGDEFTMPGNAVTIKAIFDPIPGATTPGVTEPVETTDPNDPSYPGNSIEPGSSDGDTEPSKPDNSTETGNTSDSENTTSTGSNDSKNGSFNWLWVLFGGLAVVAVGGGIAFIIIKKKEKKQED